MTYESRDQIPEQYKWDLSSLYPSDEAFLEALAKAQDLPASFNAWHEKGFGTAENLLGYLKDYDRAEVLLETLINYAERKSDEDTRVAKYQDFSAKATAAYVDFAAATSWASTALMALSQETLESYFASLPELEHYRRALDLILRMREHTLSDKEEALLAAALDMGGQPGRIFSLLNDADLTFPDVVDKDGKVQKLSHANYISLVMNNDRTLRKSAFDALYGRYHEFRNTFAASLTAQEKSLSFFARARNYESALDYSLDKNEVPSEVYHNLLDAVHNNMEAMYKYVALRKRALGVDELHFYDLYVPLLKDVDMHYTYEEACDLMLKALAPMGEEYLSLVKKGISERWIDVYSTSGKRGGAYSAGNYGTNPIILLNFQGTLDDVFTLVHEMGHSIHSYLSRHAQSATYSNYVLFVAEVASTCNEALLSNYLLEHETDPARHAYVLNNFVESFRSTLYRQAMFAEFEREISKICDAEGSLTADRLEEVYADLNRTYFGDDIVIDDGIKMEWARIPHFYYDFYVYQYSIGYAAAIALSQQILDEGEVAVKRYVNYLSGGCSRTPIDLLKGAGVDMSTPEPVDAALKIFDKLVDQLDSELQALSAK